MTISERLRRANQPPWVRIEAADDGREGLRAAALAAPVPAGWIVLTALTGRPVWIPVLISVALALTLGLAVHRQARRNRPIKAVYDTSRWVAIAVLVAVVVWVFFV